MSLSPGAQLGVYEVTAKIGEGGMGEVYRARDTKLDRDVALKVLPEAFTADPDRLARFEREPDWAELPDEVPPAVAAVLRQCLQKDPKRRMRDIGDVSLAMDGVFDTPAPQPAQRAAAPSLHLWQRPVPAAGAALLVAGIASLAVWGLTRPAPSPPDPLTRFALDLPGLPPGVGPMLVEMSPDGRTLVYAAGDQLYRRDMAELEWQPIPGTENAFDPQFSPDGQWLAFEDAEGLKRVRVDGGPAATIVEGVIRGMSWAPDDTVIYALAQSGLSRAPASGDVAEPLTTLAEGEITHMAPDVLPDGEAALFTVRDRDGDHLAIVSLDDGERRMLSLGGGRGRYLPTGHIIFSRDSALWAVPFDADRQEVVGSPVPVLEDVQVPFNSGYAQAVVAPNGTLMYLTAAAGSGATRTLAWVDRNGREEPLPAERRLYNHPRISPDGTRLAVLIEGDIWTWDVAAATLTRLTFDPDFDGAPTWTPDSRRVLFESSRGDTTTQIYARAADGTGVAERLTDHPSALIPLAVSSDGRHLVMQTQRNEGTGDLLRMEMDGDGTVEVLLDSDAIEWNAALSPDDRWLAYQSDESGRNEVYVRPFPDVSAGRWQVSRAGGVPPVWSPDGRELFFIDPVPNLMAAPVDGEDATFTRGNPEVLFEVGSYFINPTRRGYDVSPDGTRFLLVNPSASEDDILPEIVIVQNWFEELERLAPVQ